MLLDFGVDPRALDDMSLAEITSMMAALERRRGKAKAPTEEEADEAMQEFAAMVANDPSVRLH